MKQAICTVILSVLACNAYADAYVCRAFEGKRFDFSGNIGQAPKESDDSITKQSNLFKIVGNKVYAILSLKSEEMEKSDQIENLINKAISQTFSGVVFAKGVNYTSAVVQTDSMVSEIYTFYDNGLVTINTPYSLRNMLPIETLPYASNKFLYSFCQIIKD